MNTAADIHSFPTQVSPDGRWLLDQHHRPFYWLGDTAWSLFTRYSREAAKTYLETRARQGFTVIQAVIGWFDGLTPDAYGVGANDSGAHPWVEGDPACPNPLFFDRVDDLLQVAEQLGLTLAILPTWGNFVTDVHLFTPENAHAYAQWLGERYRDRPNLVWINGGDALPHGYESVFDALGQGLWEGVAGRHLLTYHPCHLHSSSQYFNHSQWLDFHTIQSWTDWHQVYNSVISDCLTLPRRPVVLGEGAYENGPEYPRGPITPLIVRRQAWWTFMAGGYFTYGQNSIWRCASDWQALLAAPGAVQMGILREIIAPYPWWQRIPDQAVIEVGQGEGETLNAAVRAEDGRWLMVYLSSRAPVLVRLEKLAARQAKATLVNPANGERKEAGTYETYTMPGFRQVRTTNYQWFRVPDYWEDAVLLLEGLV